MKADEFLIAVVQEYLHGIHDTIDFMRQEGIICKREDNCGECKKIDAWYEKRYKEISER